MFICNISDVLKSEVYGVDVSDIGRLAVYNVDGTYYVTDDECTHAKASLSDGLLEGTVIECPVHGGQFDVVTGKALKGPCFKQLRIYPVKLVDDQVHIESEHADT
jgi:nitrite reductase/ring-hydroxylating ferredoxin subunit